MLFYACKALKVRREWCEEVESARYTWFIGLYPVGAMSEWVLIYRAWSTFSPVSAFFHLLFLSLMIIWPLGTTLSNSSFLF